MEDAQARSNISVEVGGVHEVPPLSEGQQVATGRRRRRRVSFLKGVVLGRSIMLQQKAKHQSIRAALVGCDGSNKQRNHMKIQSWMGREGGVNLGRVGGRG